MLVLQVIQKVNKIMSRIESKFKIFVATFINEHGRDHELDHTCMRIMSIKTSYFE